MALMTIRIRLIVVGASAALACVFGLLTAAPVAATFTCNQDSGVCTDDSVVQTPLGQVDISVSDRNVVTVHLAPIYRGTLVLGIARSYPPGPPTTPGYSRTSVVTTGGTVYIDTIHAGPLNVAVISIHPPSPCRVSTSGTTVVFTPVYPPGPPT
jgi:hypothetical protein